MVKWRGTYITVYVSNDTNLQPIALQFFQSGFEFCHRFYCSPRGAYSTFLQFRFRYLNEEKFKMILLMWETFVINCVSEMKSNTSTCSVSILPLNNISWYVDFTIGTNLVDIQVLSWSICFYRLAMLRAAVLNLLVLGIRKLGWLLIRF